MSFTKGCYVGQETVARLYYRGKPNRRLLGLRLSEPVEPGTELRLGEKVVGKLGSVVVSPDHGPIALALVRREANPGDTVDVDGCHGTHRRRPLRAVKSVQDQQSGPGRELPMAAHVIVLANRTAAAPELIEALVHRGERGPIHATLVMPAAGPGSAARAECKERLDAALEAWRAAGIERCEGVVCDPVPLEALAEVWDPMRHDEVIVCDAARASRSKWIRGDLPHAVARYTGVSVLHVVAHDPEVGAGGTPAPVHEKAPLGPLSVLAWGGKQA